MQQSDRLMQRILTTYEQTVFQKLKSEQRRVEYLAGRFAAKEAFAKATGQGIGQLSLQHIEVRSNYSGAPELYVEGYDNVNIFISITHTKQYAADQVVIEDVLSSQQFCIFPKHVSYIFSAGRGAKYIIKQE